MAIGHEPPIEPWLTLQDQVRLPSFKTRLASSPPKDETHRKGRQARAKPLDRNRGGTYRKWAGSRDKNLLGLRSRKNFFLDIPFYRTESGLDLETKIFSASGRGRTFFLTSLFIELTDRC